MALGSTASTTVVVDSDVPQGSSSEATAEKPKDKGEKEVDRMRLADAAKCEVYVCFEGPLGAHLKPEVPKKFGRGSM